MTVYSVPPPFLLPEDSETIDVEGTAVPIVAAFVNGQPAPLIGDTVVSACDHRGATWSSEFALYCHKCGARLFLPPRLLAHLPEQQIEQMATLWHLAGCPPWYGDHWGITPGYWTIIAVPTFAMTGGLPVLNTRRASIRTGTSA